MSVFRQYSKKHFTNAVLFIHNQCYKNVKQKLNFARQAHYCFSWLARALTVLKFQSYVNKTTGHVTLTYLLYKIKDTSLLLVLKVIFKLRAAKNASIISEFERLSTSILLCDSACSLYNFMKDST